MIISLIYYLLAVAVQVANKLPSQTSVYAIFLQPFPAPIKTGTKYLTTAVPRPKILFLLSDKIAKICQRKVCLLAKMLYNGLSSIETVLLAGECSNVPAVRPILSASGVSPR